MIFLLVVGRDDHRLKIISVSGNDQIRHTVQNKLAAPLVAAARIAAACCNRLSPWDCLANDKTFNEATHAVWVLQVRTSSSKLPSFLLWGGDCGPELSAFDREEREQRTAEFVLPIWSAMAGNSGVWRLSLRTLSPGFDEQNGPWWKNAEAVLSRVPDTTDLHFIAIHSGVRPERCEKEIRDKYGIACSALADAETRIISRLMGGHRKFVAVDQLYYTVNCDCGHVSFPSLEEDDKRKEIDLVGVICEAARKGTECDLVPVKNKSKFDGKLLDALLVEFYNCTPWERADKIKNVSCNVCTGYGHFAPKSRVESCVYRNFVKFPGRMRREIKRIPPVDPEKVASEKAVYLLARIASMCFNCNYKLTRGLIPFRVKSLEEIN